MTFLVGYSVQQLLHPLNSISIAGKDRPGWDERNQKCPKNAFLSFAYLASLQPSEGEKRFWIWPIRPAFVITYNAKCLFILSGHKWFWSTYQDFIYLHPYFREIHVAAFQPTHHLYWLLTPHNCRFSLKCGQDSLVVLNAISILMLLELYLDGLLFAHWCYS